VNSWSTSRTSSMNLTLPNICNLIVFFKRHLGGGYIDSILELKSKNQYDYIQKCYFPRQIHGQKVFISICQ
jgi:hypothetical protein